MFRRPATTCTGVFSFRGSQNVATSNRRHSTVAVDVTDALLDISAFGRYELVLPADPHQMGVDHIIPVDVPAWIERPDYANQASPLSRTISRPKEPHPRDGLTRGVAMSAGALIARRALQEARNFAKVRYPVLHHQRLYNHINLAGIYYSPDQRRCSSSDNRCLSLSFTIAI